MKRNQLRDKKIVKLYLDGKTCRQISKIINISFQRVHQILKRLNIKTRSKITKQFLNEQQIRQLHEQYLVDRTIIDKQTICHQTILRYFRIYGLKIIRGRLLKLFQQDIFKYHELYLKIGFIKLAKQINISATTLKKNFVLNNLYVRPRGMKNAK